MDKHIEFLPRLAAYHDGALEAGEHASVKAHVEQCAQCRAILDDWKAVDLGLKSLDGQTVADLKDDIMVRIAALPARRRINFVFQKPYWSMAAAAVLLIFSATFWLQTGEEPQRSVPPSAIEPAPQSEEISALTPSEQAPAASASREASVPSQPKSQPLDTAATQVTIAGSESPSTVDKDRSSTLARSNQAGNREYLEREMLAFDVRPDAETPITSESERELLRSDAARSREGQVGKTFGSPSAAAVAPFSAEVSGILQQDWPSRLVEALRIYYRIPDLYEAAFVEVNLLPVFDAEFVAVGYGDNDLLEESYDVASVRPMRLSPEAAYLVANLRLERAALLARLTNQVRSPDAEQRLADLTWQLANITVDQEDVRHAIAAQDAAMRQNPALGVQARARMVHLRTLVIR